MAYEITKELIAAHERLAASLKINLDELERVGDMNIELSDLVATLSETITTGEVFIKHINAHLKEGEHVICMICNKTVDEIYEEDKAKYVKKGKYVFSYQQEGK